MTSYGVRPPIYRHLDTDGDGTGVHDAVGDYTGDNPTDFYIQDTKRDMYLERMIVYIEDVGNFDSGKYGNGVEPTNGIHILITDANDNTVQFLTADDEAIKTNAHWAEHCHDMVLFNWAAGNDSASARWTFRRDLGAPLHIPRGHKFKATLHDTFVGLEKHEFAVRGHY